MKSIWVLCILLAFVVNPVFAQPPYYSADGDTAYLGENVIIRDKSISHVAGPLPEYSNTITSTTWGDDVRLTDLAQYGNVGGPIPLISNNIMGAFATIGSVTPGYDIYKILSSNWGQSWAEPESVEVESTFVIGLASPDTVIYMTGSTQGVFKNSYFIRSFDDGVTWLNYYEFEETDLGYIGKGTLNDLGDSVFITYYIGSRDDVDVDSIIFSASGDRGETWSDVRGIINMFSDMYHHCVRISQGRMHIVFQDLNQGLIDIFYSHSDNFGLTWSDPVFVSDNDSYSSQWPYLSADSAGNLCVSWFDYKYGSGPSGYTGDLLYRVSHNNGESWESEERLTYDHNCTASRSIIDGDYLNFIWADHYFGWLHANLSFKESYDFGNTWSDKYEITNNGPEHNIYGPEVLFDNSNIYLFWMDDRDSWLFNYEIYFNKGELNTTSILENPIIPNGFGISSIYPNPFNSSTTINYQLPEESDISLEVYDILGRKILAESFPQQSAGLHKYNLDMSNQPSGLFFIRISSPDGFSSAIKTILLK